MSAKLDYALARYREAQETSMEAQLTATRARNIVQRAEQLLAHHLSVLVEQDGKWAQNPVEGTTLEDAKRAVAEWDEARVLAVRAKAKADFAEARKYECERDMLDASRKQ